MWPLDLDSVRCFVAAADAASFRAAAAEVALSPAAFSSRMRTLEEALGVRLFQRSTRRVDLTPDGVRALPSARALLASARSFSASARGTGASPFSLTIGTRFEMGLSWLVPLLGPLSRARPERVLHVAFGDSPDLVQRTEHGNIDATLTSARLVSRRLRTAALHEERYALVALPALVQRMPLRSAADAAHHTLIDADPGLPLFRYFLDACPAGETWSFQRTELVGAIAAIRMRALEGAGVAVLPRFLIDEDVRDGRLRVLLPGRKLARDHLRLVWREGHPLEHEVHALAEELLRAPLSVKAFADRGVYRAPRSRRKS